MEKSEEVVVVRKGPWSEEEDVQLVLYVNLFGDRRWDFVAKVSGLKRTGKSCRLRWVNYLHPGLKRGKITPHEDRLIRDLHSKWGNRWSRIARKVPGRTDNEIKNYWRTLTRKINQKKKATTPQSSSSSSSSSTTAVETDGRSFYDTGGMDLDKVYSMDEIWKDMEESSNFMTINNPPAWDFDSIWPSSVDETDSKMAMTDRFNSFPFHNIDH